MESAEDNLMSFLDLQGWFGLLRCISYRAMSCAARPPITISNIRDSLEAIAPSSMNQIMQEICDSWTNQRFKQCNIFASHNRYLQSSLCYSDPAFNG